MTEQLTPEEMYHRMIRDFSIQVANVEPSDLSMPTAYVSVPTASAFASPFAIKPEPKNKNAKLGSRSSRNPKRKR